MRLEKWYADVVDAGVASIRYCAEFQLGPLHLGYSRRIQGDQAHSKFKLGRCELPRIEDRCLVWPGEHALRWRGCSGSDRTLWATDGRSLSWNPVVLNGPVEGPGLSRSARGYAERLVLDFAPWHLGMDLLKWGRFCGQLHSLVWIEWEGKIAKQLALLDGKECLVERISAAAVSCREVALQAVEARMLVRAPISRAAKALSPLLGRPGALRFLSGLEQKWLARATLELANGEQDAGFAIYEEVAWARRGVS